MAAPEQRSPEAQQRRRRVYLRHRIPIVYDEVEKLVEESQSLGERLKNAEAQDAQELQERLIYVLEHRAALRNELNALTQEQQDLRKARGVSAKRAAPE